MTINSTYAAENVNIEVDQIYEFSFDIIDAAHLEIYEVDVAGNYTLVDSADYSVVVYGNPPIYGGGQITFGQPHDASATTLSLERNTPKTQLVDYFPYSSFPADTHEFALDKAVLISQELDFQLNRLGQDAPPWDPQVLYADRSIIIQDSQDPPAENGWFMQVNKTGGGNNQFFMERLGTTSGTPSEFLIQVYDDTDTPRLLWLRSSGELEIPRDLIVGREAANLPAGGIELRSASPEADINDYSYYNMYNTPAGPMDARLQIEPGRSLTGIGTPEYNSGDVAIITSPDGVTFHNFLFGSDGTLKINGATVQTI